MKKWLVATLFSLCVALAVAPGAAFADTGDWTYDPDADTLTYVDDATLVIKNVTDDGTGSLTIGNNSNSNYVSLDLTGEIKDTEGKGYSIIGLEQGAFSECTSLQSIKLPDTITSVEERLFEECEKLSSVTLPANLTYISDYMFCECSSLESIDLPDSITSIGAQAFGNCSFLSSVTLPANLTSIGNSAFNHCAFSSIVIPANVTSIGVNAFDFCSNLTTVTVLAVDPPKIDSLSFDPLDPPSSIKVPCISVEDYKNESGWSNYKDIITGPHSWGETTYTWSSDNSKCTATHACTYSGCNSTESEAVDTSGKQTKDPTCTDKGETTYTATFAVDWATEQTKTIANVAALGHTLTKTEAKDATCTEDGNSEYWYCDTCKKYFSDENGANEITLADTVIPASHTYQDGKCAICGKADPNYSPVTTTDTEKSDSADSAADTEKKALAQTSDASTVAAMILSLVALVSLSAGVMARRKIRS